jgi:hypothetical protein
MLDPNERYRLLMFSSIRLEHSVVYHKVSDQKIMQTSQETQTWETMLDTNAEHHTVQRKQKQKPRDDVHVQVDESRKISYSGRDHRTSSRRFRGLQRHLLVRSL